MSIGIVGVKGGMTRVFDDTGASIPVTVVQAKPNRVVQVKTPEKDSYSAIQVTFGAQKERRVNRPITGHYQSADVALGRGLCEFRTEAITEEVPTEAGSALTVNQFEPGEVVDVRGQSKGKGFAGAVKRWNFSTQDNTHGNSLSHRAAGSIGQCQTPGKVFKGKKMAGHMGNERVTVQNLQVVAVDSEHDILLIKGAVPGPTGGNVVVTPAVKQSKVLA